jgi:hypothetical protein
MYQTDFHGFIREDGCLFASIVTAIEQRFKKQITNARIEELVILLHGERASYNKSVPVLSDERDQGEVGVFVWDHEAVGNRILDELGVTDMRFKYNGRIYTQYEEARGRKSFGVPKGNVCILQIKTLHGNGHFRLLNHDPYQPAREMMALKSVRYYSIEMI